MSDHISISQWTRYFSRKATEDERLQILRHVAECEACRNLRDKANDFRFALERQKQAGGPLFETEGMEYAAVAGVRPVSEVNSGDGILTVELIQTGLGYAFAEDTLETSGAGKKYVINCSGDRRELTDGGGALSVIIRDNELVLKLTDAYVRGFASLLNDQQDESEVEISSGSVLPLPAQGNCLLQIIFREG